MRDPEVGASVKGFVGFLNHDQLEGRVWFGWFAADEISHKDHTSHSKLRHFFGEALEFALEHTSALATKAEHHRGHGINLRGVEYVSNKANREIGRNVQQQKEAGDTTGTGLDCLSE